MADISPAPLWLSNLRAMIGTKRGDISRVAKNSGPMKLSQLQAILSGDNLKPQVNTLERIARACGKELEDVFTRPEREAGHADTDTTRREGAQFLEMLAKVTDGEIDTEHTWRGDVLKAIAVLSRALGRPDREAAPTEASKAGR